MGRVRTLAALGSGAVALAVLLPEALRRPLWQDEVASARVIFQPSLGGALERIARRESTPPGWYLLAWLGHRADIPLLALRFLSVAFAVVSAALLVAAAFRLLPPLAATAAGLLLVFSWQFAFHGTELRTYALLGLISLVFALALERAAEEPSLRRLILLAACVALGSSSHYFFLFSVCGGVVWLWSEPGLRRVRRRLSVVMALGLAPLLPWLPSFMQQLGNQRYGWIGPFNALKVAAAYAALFQDPVALYAKVSSGVGSAPELVLRLVVLVLVLTGFVLLFRRSPRGRLWALLGLLPVTLAAVMWLAGLRIFDARNLVETAPFVVAALAGALSAAPRRAVPLALAAAVALAGAGLALAPPSTPPYNRLATALEAQGWRPRDPLLLLPDQSALRTPLDWYLSRPMRAVRSRDLSCCAPEFVVATRSRWRRLEGRPFQLVSQERIGQFVIARVGGRLTEGRLRA